MGAVGCGERWGRNGMEQKGPRGAVGSAGGCATSHRAARLSANRFHQSSRLCRMRPRRDAQPKAGEASSRLPFSRNPLWRMLQLHLCPGGGGLPEEAQEVGRQNYRGEGSQRIGSQRLRSSLSSLLLSSGKFSSIQAERSHLRSSAICSRKEAPPAPYL